MRHNNFADMNHLSVAVLKVPDDQKLRFAAHVLGHRLMMGPWWLRGLHRVVSWTRGWHDTITWALLLDRMSRRGVNLIDDVIDGLAHHIILGKDVSDPRSVGGLNQQEVNTLVLLLGSVSPALSEFECEGADDPEERCPRHPRDCVCWKIDPARPTKKAKGCAE